MKLKLIVIFIRELINTFLLSMALQLSYHPAYDYISLEETRSLPGMKKTPPKDIGMNVQLPPFINNYNGSTNGQSGNNSPLGNVNEFTPGGALWSSEVPRAR